MQRQLEALRAEKEKIEEHQRQENLRLREERESYEQSLFDMEQLGLSTDFLSESTKDYGGDVLQFEDSAEVSKKLLKNIRAMRSELESDLFLTQENCMFGENDQLFRLSGPTTSEVSYVNLMEGFE